MSEPFKDHNLSNLNDGAPRRDVVDDDDDDDLCEPPSTFSVETVSPDDQKLNWLVFTSGIYCNPLPGNSAFSVPGNPFYPIGSTAVCGLCLMRRRTFYCEDCIQKGEFGHSNLRRPECLSEKRLKEIELSRKIESLKNEIARRTSVTHKISLLNEQIKCCKQRTKYLRNLVDNEKAKVNKNLENKVKLSQVNVRRRQRLPLFADKVRKISDYLRKYEDNLDAEKNATGRKLKVLAGIRRKYAEDIGRFIFPIVIETHHREELDARHRENQSEDRHSLSEDISEAMGMSPPRDWAVSASRYRFDSPAPDLSSDDSSRLLGGIADEINDAMGTSYIHGRWVTATHSRSQDVRLYRIASAVISSTDESPAFPALTDKDVDLARATEIHTFSAGLTFCSQLLSLLSACFDVLQPKRIHFSDFGVPPKTEYKFYKLISRLNLNIVHLCLSQGIDTSELRSRQFLHNLYVLFDHIKRDDLTTIGSSYRPLLQTDRLYTMSHTICTDLDLLSEDHNNQDSEDESENDEFRDWEAVTPGMPSNPLSEGWGLGPIPAFHTTSTMFGQPSPSHVSTISTASTFMTSLFRGLTGGAGGNN